MAELPHDSVEIVASEKGPIWNPDGLISSEEKQVRLFEAVQRNIAPHSTRELTELSQLVKGTQPFAALTEEQLVGLTRDAIAFNEDAHQAAAMLTTLKDRIETRDRRVYNQDRRLHKNTWASSEEVGPAIANLERRRRLAVFAWTADPEDDYIDDVYDASNEQAMNSLQASFDSFSIDELLLSIQDAIKSEQVRAQFWMEQIAGNDDGKTLRRGLVDIDSAAVQQVLLEAASKS